MQKQHSLEAVWHAYIIRGYADFRYNVHTMVDEEMLKLCKNYLKDVYGDNEWAKKAVLDIIKDRTRKDMRREARMYFPSLFVKKRPAYPLNKPQEDPELVLNINAIKNLTLGLLELKETRRPQLGEGVDMSDNTTMGTPNTEFTGVIIELTKLVKDGTKTKSGKDRLVPTTVTVDAGELTLNNFSEKTGRRFRMSKGQTERFGKKGQAQAFAEWLTEAVSAAKNRGES